MKTVESFKKKEHDNIISIAIKNKDNEDVMIDVNVDEMERDKKHPYVRLDQVHLDFQAKENYDLINVVADGFYGYRCLAAVYYGMKKSFGK